MLQDISLKINPQCFMTKFEKIWGVCVAVSALCIVAFWVAGFNDELSAAAYLLATAGAFACAAVVTAAVQTIHKRRYGF